jgi:hypothetical protein
MVEIMAVWENQVFVAVQIAREILYENIYLGGV